MMDGDAAFYEHNPVVHEGRRTTERGFCFVGEKSYNYTKDITEKVYDEAAAKSPNNWIAIHANPGDIIGPILVVREVVEVQQHRQAIRIVEAIGVVIVICLVPLRIRGACERDSEFSEYS